MDQEAKNEVLSLPIRKYPRTAHLESSRLQEGDEDCEQIPYASLKGKHLVLEEKLDGGNLGISFDGAGELLLQSRGHYLVGGGRERQFNQAKAWARAHEGWLLERLEDRFICFGECMSKKHSVFYDALPHVFAEFDVFDRTNGKFLSTEARHALLAGGPVLSVPVLHDGPAPAKLADLWKLVKPSKGRSAHWRQVFERVVAREGFNLARAWEQCDQSDLAEGLYGKVEEGGEVIGRFKLVRQDFVQAIIDSEQHHSEQPYIPNQLRPGVDIFSPTLTHGWEA